MKESDFQNWLLDVAKRTGWSVWHVPVPMVWSRKKGTFVPSSQGKGLPDLIMLHEDPPSMILAELKGDSGRLSEEQRHFLHLARAVSEQTWPATSRRLGVYVWKPGLEDFIETVLKTRVMA